MVEIRKLENRGKGFVLHKQYLSSLMQCEGNRIV